VKSHRISPAEPAHAGGLADAWYPTRDIERATPTPLDVNGSGISRWGGHSWGGSTRPVPELPAVAVFTIFVVRLGRKEEISCLTGW